MQADEEGFLYPVVNTTRCIQCSKCVKVCPYTDSEFTNKPEKEELSVCYAAYNKNEEIRYKSASGGMFRVFDDKIIAEGGVVFGATFDKDFTVEHTYTETLEGLTAFMGSKYLQSRMEDSFIQVKRFLREGRKVLFTGCACQIAGLKRYLKKDDANLICIDLICHGVDSPQIWLDSFIAKQVGNVRDVGVTLGYKFGTGVPVTLEGGLYNGSGLTNQKEWHKEVNYSAKAQFLFAKKLNLALSIQSIQPQEVRINSYDIGAFYEFGRFHIEGEYLYKTYADNAYDNVHAVNSFINYDLPLRKVFSKMSFLARYDMMTSQSDGKAIDEETGALTTTDYKRHRITGGITFSLSKAFRTDLRLNYEKYFYAKNSIAKESEQDKIVLELMVRF